MSSPLSSIEFIPRGSNGWTSGRLDFGAGSTVLLGKNGSGKTPLLTGLAWALGHPLELPPAIVLHCRSVVLSLNGGGYPARVERNLTPGFEVSVTVDGNKIEQFSEEKGYTAWILNYLGIPLRNLAGRDSGIVAPYMSILVPMFWVDQDLGWRNLYSPLSTHNFVWDQQDEVSRWLLGVPAKHRPMDKSAFTEAKQRLDSLNEQVSIKRKTIEALNREIGADSRSESRERLVKRRESLLAELERNNSALETLVKSTSSLDNKVDEAKRARDGIKFALDSAERRIAELRRLGEELKSEVSILETNEIAADAFRVLCGNETCQFFRRPEESYGRRLLYLKDQLKDFQSSFGTMEQDIGSLRSDLNESEKQLRDAIQARQLNVSKLPSGQIVPVIDAITRELSEINLRIERIDSTMAEQKRFEAMIESTLKQEEEVRSLRPTGGGNSDQTRLNEIRETLTTCFKEWLKVLNTQNMPEKIWFDEDIRLNLGDERFSENSPFKGSTRTRIVLAYHASVVETSLKKDGYHPPFLVLDTPKQHELHAADLAAFVTRFEEMVFERKKAFQLVIGATEEDFVAKTASGVFWRPRFGTADEPRFLGLPGTEFDKPNAPVPGIQNQPDPKETS